MPAGTPKPTMAEPAEPTDLPTRSWWQILKRTVAEFQDDNLTDWAAALTYYGVMSLFPMLIALVAVLGLVGQSDSINTLLDSFREAGLGGVADNVQKPLTGVVNAKGGAGALLGLGLLGSLWSASGYLGAFIRASNSIYEVREGRPFWKLRPLQIALTLSGVFLLSLVAIGLVVSGPLAEAIGKAIGLGNTGITVWGIAKWPVMLVIVMAVLAALYYIAPNVRQPRFRWVTPGGILAVLLWALASVGFGLYVAHFGSYNKTYGTLGGVISFLVWLWISNLALLLGAELDAELERERELKAGLPAERELKLPPKQPASGAA
jgi:membrane protein